MHVTGRGARINQPPGQQTLINCRVYHAGLIASASSAAGADKIQERRRRLRIGSHLISPPLLPETTRLQEDEKFSVSHLPLKKTATAPSVITPIR